MQVIQNFMFLLKLSQQLKPGFNYNINRIKYQSKGPRQAQNQYLDCLINPSFQGVNKFFVLSFKNKAQRTIQTRYFFPTVEMKDSSVMTDSKLEKQCGKTIWEHGKTFENIPGLGDDYTIGCK